MCSFIALSHPLVRARCYSRFERKGHHIDRKGELELANSRERDEECIVALAHLWDIIRVTQGSL